MLHGVTPDGIGGVDGIGVKRVGGLLLPAKPLWPAMLPLMLDQRAGQTPFGRWTGILQAAPCPQQWGPTTCHHPRCNAAFDPVDCGPGP